MYSSMYSVFCESFNSLWRKDNNNTDFMVFIWKISHLFVSLSPERITNKNDNYNEEIIDYYLRGLGLGADGIG
jgi:hypothetical protein